MSQVTVIPRARHGATVELEGEAVLVFDATLSESISDEGELTAHPVEQGADVADHFRRRNTKLSMEVVLSDTPLHEEPADGRARKLYEQLLELHRSGQPYTLVTGLRVFNNMVLVSVEANRNAEAGRSVPLTLNFEQVRIAETRAIDIPAALLGSRAKPGGQGTTDAGNQPPAEAGDEVQAAANKDTPPSDRKSVLKGGLDALGGLLGG